MIFAVTDLEGTVIVTDFLAATRSRLEADTVVHKLAKYAS